LYQVNELEDKRTRAGRTQYKVRWEDGSAASWEPTDNATEELISAYEAKQTAALEQEQSKQGYAWAVAGAPCKLQYQRQWYSTVVVSTSLRGILVQYTDGPDADDQTQLTYEQARSNFLQHRDV
jgi:hypothetical protein